MIRPTRRAALLGGMLAPWAALALPAPAQARFPDVPTLREQGLDIAIGNPGGLIGPRGMDPAVVATLAEAFRAAAQDPAHLAFLERMDQPLMLLDGDACRAQMRRTMEEERGLLRRLGLLPA